MLESLPAPPPKKKQKEKKRKMHVDSACEGFSFQPLISFKLSRTSAFHSQGHPHILHTPSPHSY